MTARFSHHVELAADPGAVFAVLVDPVDLVARYEASGSADVTVLDHRRDGDAVTVVYRRVESGGLPPQIARLVRGAAQVTQTDVWTPEGTGWRARWTVLTKGVPVEIGGHVEVGEHGAGTRLTEGGSVTARLPMIGGMIERLAVEQSGVKLRREWEWLAARFGSSNRPAAGED